MRTLYSRSRGPSAVIIRPAYKNPVKLDAATRAERHGEQWILKTDLKNTSAQPALMVRLKAVREKSGDRILPALYSDNYVSLMPGEQRTIRIQIENADTRGESPRIVVEGFNIQ